MAMHLKNRVQNLMSHPLVMHTNLVQIFTITSFNQSDSRATTSTGLILAACTSIAVVCFSHIKTADDEAYEKIKQMLCYAQVLVSRRLKLNSLPLVCETDVSDPAVSSVVSQVGKGEGPCHHEW